MSSSEPGLIDCGLWAQKATFKLIGPHLAASWRDWLRIGERIPTGGHIELPESQYFVEGPALRRAAEGADAQAEVREHLDRHGIEAAVFNPGAATSLAGLASPLLAAATAQAVNDWTTADWLSADERLRGSIVIALHDPLAAANEIRRAAADTRMAQVVLAYPQRLLGDRWFHPIYEAASELGLPIVLQAGGDYSGSNPGVTPVGNPASTLEAFVSWEYAGQPHLISLILGGVFDRFPNLRVVLDGFGAAWLPSVIWRLEHELGRARAPIARAPARRPSEYIAQHIRITTAQLELSEPHALRELLTMVDGEHLLVFASGQLRGDPDSDLEALDALGPSWRGELIRNAAALYSPTRAAASA